MTDKTLPQAAPHSLSEAPTLIETIWPAQKISKEAEVERKSVSGQTLTGLGGYWKGRKPLILNRACILGALLPSTGDPETDLEVFESLMMIDDEGFVDRGRGRQASDYAEMAVEHGFGSAEEIGSFFVNRDTGGAIGRIDADIVRQLGRRIAWRADLRDGGWRSVAADILSRMPYDKKVDASVRPEYLGAMPALAADRWTRINGHLGTSAASLGELVEQLGIMRFGHRPKVGDSFSGSGQIPFEALRLGCDSYASDQNPIAALLTWSSFELAGTSEEDVAALMEELAVIETAVEEDLAPFETNVTGDRAKAYLYCLEVRCPITGYMVPLVPSWVISPKHGTIGRLVPDHATKRMEVEIVNGASAAELKAAETGTISGDHVVYDLDGETHRFSMSALRGDQRGDAVNPNRLRKWAADDIAPRDDDLLGERLYCVQWASSETLDLPRQAVRFARPDADDLGREIEVREHVERNLAAWRAEGLIADMPIEAGLKTDDPMRTRGWTNWLHLFHPRQILLLATLHRRIKAHRHAAKLYFFMPRALDNSSRLNRWKASQGGGLGGVVGTFDNQALNTLANFAVRGSLGLRSLVGGPARAVELDAPRRIDTLPGSLVAEPRDIWITDPPYADAVVYHELTEFFISWLRRNPPKPFDEWTWDSRRPLAIQGEGEDFRRKMVDTYGNLASLMPDNGMQIVMFTHQSVSVWGDLASIFWGAGLKVSAAWYIATETGSNAPGKSGKGLVQGTVILVLRKRLGVESGYEDEIVQDVRAEVAKQIDTMVGLNQSLKGAGRIDNIFSDADMQMAGYAAALRVLTGYTRIDGRDMTSEALRARRKGETSFVDRMIDYAVGIANEHMVPEGIRPALWQQMTGSERFYLKMIGLEADGFAKLDNYQNFARAFRVSDYTALMASMTPNAARLRNGFEFGARAAFDMPDFGNGLVRATLYGIYQLERETDPDVVLQQLRDIVPNYFKRRGDIVEIAEHLARRRGPTPEGRYASILANLLRNERL